MEPFNDIARYMFVVWTCFAIYVWPIQMDIQMQAIVYPFVSVIIVVEYELWPWRVQIVE